MRTRKEIEEGASNFAPDGMENMRGSMLEVLLDIRDLLTRPPAATL
jgi:hypothetical protein